MAGAGVDWAMISDGHAPTSLMIERGGRGMILRGMMFIFCPAMMFVVDRNSVKYALDTQNHTPRGYEGMKNRCLWKGPKKNCLAIQHSS